MSFRSAVRGMCISSDSVSHQAMKKFLTVRRPIFFGLSLLVSIGWFAAGCASPKQHAFSPLPVDLFETDKASPLIERTMIGDVVIVKFTLEWSPPHEQQIREDGTITLPLIGAINASGKTAHELETEIKNRYVPDFYKRLSVTVAIGRGAYDVGGQVQRPGRVHYLGPTTVTKAIESAGGFTEFTKGTRVQLTRVDGKMYIVDCKKAAKDPSLDLKVYPGDKIQVPQQGPPMDIFR